MQFPRWYARWNRLATNKLVRLWAGWVPTMGLLTHRGRKSGRQYRTPLNVFPTSTGVAVFLPYGAASTDWLKNIQAAGEAELQRYRTVFRVDSPQVMAKTEARPLVLARWRRIYSLAPFAETLVLNKSAA